MKAHGVAAVLAALVLPLSGGAVFEAVFADESAAFAPLMGWWKGEGRLGFQEGQTEAVNCRATYAAGAQANSLEQSIRCATASGKVEIKSTIIDNGGQLSGTWSELVYNMAGELSGAVTERGYRVSVNGGGNLRADMEIIAKDSLQVIEIKFNGNSLRGLTLVLKKG